jgi:hypothetical protein
MNAVSYATLWNLSETQSSWVCALHFDEALEMQKPKMVDLSSFLVHNKHHEIQLRNDFGFPDNGSRYRFPEHYRGEQSMETITRNIIRCNARSGYKLTRRSSSSSACLGSPHRLRRIYFCCTRGRVYETTEDHKKTFQDTAVTALYVKSQKK